MNAVMELPIVLTQPDTSPQCATFDVRHASISDAVPEADLARLAAAAIGGIARPGVLFMEEAGPATGGDFLGLAATDLHAVSAEAIDTVRYCRFSHARLHTLMYDYPLLEK